MASSLILSPHTGRLNGAVPSFVPSLLLPLFFHQQSPTPEQAISIVVAYVVAPRGAFARRSDTLTLNPVTTIGVDSIIAPFFVPEGVFRPL